MDRLRKLFHESITRGELIITDHGRKYTGLDHEGKKTYTHYVDFDINYPTTYEPSHNNLYKNYRVSSMDIVGMTSTEIINRLNLHIIDSFRSALQEISEETGRQFNA